MLQRRMDVLATMKRLRVSMIRSYFYLDKQEFLFAYAKLCKIVEHRN